jgi:hypothetical protein
LRRVFEKPLGHALDYEVLAMTMRGAEGPTLFARALEQYFTSVGPGLALARRPGELALLLETEMARSERRGLMRIATVGGGGVPELLMFLRAGGIGRYEVTLIDSDPGALAYAQDQLAAVREHVGVDVAVRCLQMTPHELIDDGASLDLVPGQDIICVASLLDMLGDRVSARLLATLLACLKDEGSLLAATLVRNDDIRFLFELVAEWFLAYRNDDGLRKLLVALPTGASIETQSGPSGDNRYLVVRRGQSGPLHN